MADNRSAAAGPDSTVYARFKSHFSATRGNTEISVTESLRDLHPDKHITAVSVSSADLLEFAGSGKADASLVREGDEYLMKRAYFPPTGRMDPDDGKLSEQITFGRYNYTYDGDGFDVYVVQWEEDGITFDMQFILCSNKFVGADGHSSSTDKLIRDAGKYSADLHEQIYVFDGGYWQKSRKLWKAVQSSKWDDVILDPAMKETIVKDIEGFFDSRTTYEEYGVPWKRGVILHGFPGTGKTVSIKALMNSLQHRNVASLYVKSFKGCQGPQHSIRNIFQQARIMAPCMLIFEDLDSLVVDEVRSYFLNEIDGLEDNNGMLIIGSTNHLDRLDPGIAKRPSRFDRKYYYKLPGDRERILYCQYWKAKLQRTGKMDFDNEICAVVAQLTEGWSFAYMKELFVQALLAIVGGRVDADDEDEETYVQVENAARETKVVDGSAKLVKDGEKIESSSLDGEKKKKEEVKEPKAKMPEVEIPEHLKEDPLMRILHKQAKALWREMDNTEKDEINSRPKVEG